MERRQRKEYCMHRNYYSFTVWYAKEMTKDEMTKIKVEGEFGKWLSKYFSDWSVNEKSE